MTRMLAQDEYNEQMQNYHMGEMNENDDKTIIFQNRQEQMSAIKYQLSSNEFVLGIYKCLAGIVEIPDIETGKKVIIKSEPLFNEYGINRIMAFVIPIIDKATYLSNLDNNWAMQEYFNTVYDLLDIFELEAEKMGISEENYGNLSIAKGVIKLNIWHALSRAIGDGERKHINKIEKRTESIIRTEDNNKRSNFDLLGG